MEAYIIKGYRSAVGKAKKGGFKNTLNFLKKAYERKKYSSIIKLI